MKNVGRYLIGHIKNLTGSHSCYDVLEIVIRNVLGRSKIIAARECVIDDFYDFCFQSSWDEEE
jgi:hypothetical protein